MSKSLLAKLLSGVLVLILIISTVVVAYPSTTLFGGGTTEDVTEVSDESVIPAGMETTLKIEVFVYGEEDAVIFSAEVDPDDEAEHAVDYTKLALEAEGIEYQAEGGTFARIGEISPKDSWKWILYFNESRTQVRPTAVLVKPGDRLEWRWEEVDEEEEEVTSQPVILID